MKFIHNLLMAIFFSFLAIPAFANNYAEVTGKITDAETQQPLVGATIYISDLKAVTTSNANGEFTLKNKVKPVITYEVAE